MMEIREKRGRCVFGKRAGETRFERRARVEVKS